LSANSSASIMARLRPGGHTVFAYVSGFAIEEQSRGGHPAAPERRAVRDKGFQAGLDLIIAGVTASRS
jgi:TetR/AcrR family tetracycline transcriptional repressor